MTPSFEFFTTEGINLASYLVFLGYSMNILPPANGSRAQFEFVMTNELLMAVAGFERNHNGVKSLLDIRGKLYKRASDAARQAVKP